MLSTHDRTVKKQKQKNAQTQNTNVIRTAVNVPNIYYFIVGMMV